jgi:nucleotide-binding universal stress UspA family protein
MCTHGRSGWSRLIMGSVAEEVVRKVRIPVAVRAEADQVVG